MKILVDSYTPNGLKGVSASVSFMDGSGNVIDSQLMNIVPGTAASTVTLSTTTVTAIMAYVTAQGYSATSADIFFAFNASLYTLSQAAATRSIGATGFQISTTQNAEVRYTVQIVTTATIGSGGTGYVALQMSPDNVNWTEIGRITNGQVITLAIALNSVQTITGQLSGFIPAGYYVRLLSVNTTGTPTYSYVSGQEVLMN